jgi:two-component system NtrC family response regulator
MREGSFREDLFYRLNEITLRVPPLRDRIGDSVLLANFLLHKFTAQFGRRIRGYTADAVAAISTHRWPGNVRELENRVKRGVVMSEGGMITAADLELTAEAADAVYLDIRTARMQAEREVLKKALTQSKGTISKAAKLLGISRPTLYALLDAHGFAAGSVRRQAQGAGTALRLHESTSTTEDRG